MNFLIISKKLHSNGSLMSFDTKDHQSATFTIGGVKVCLTEANFELKISAEDDKPANKKTVINLVHDRLRENIREHFANHGTGAPLVYVIQDRSSGFEDQKKTSASFDALSQILSDLQQQYPDRESLPDTKKGTKNSLAGANPQLLLPALCESAQELIGNIPPHQP